MDGFSTFVTGTLGLTELPHYLPIVLLSTAGFFLVHKVLAPWGSKRWFPMVYNSKSAKTRNEWCVRIASQTHSVIIVPLALWVLYDEALSRSQDKAFGWSKETGYVHAIACGYFLWDTYVSTFEYSDWGFFVHAIACLIIYTFTFKPFLAFYATRYLLWETSTIFLNAHWFFDKTGNTGSTGQWINGLFLLTTFFGVRLVHGTILSYYFIQTLLDIRREIPTSQGFVFVIGNVLLQGLNCIWFAKLINTVRKRFFGRKGEAAGPMQEHVEKVTQNGKKNGKHC